MSDDDPAAAAARATGGESSSNSASAEAAEATEAADPTEAAEEEIELSEVLLSTEPDLNPAAEAEKLGVETHIGHGYVGVRKMLAVILPSDGPSTGTPAIVNIGFFGYGVFAGGGEEESEESDGFAFEEGA